jgi:hypothetical protein
MAVTAVPLQAAVKREVSALRAEIAAGGHGYPLLGANG